MSVSDREQGGSSTEGTQNRGGLRSPGLSVATAYSIIQEHELKEVEIAMEVKMLSIQDDESTFRAALLIHTLYKDHDMPDTNNVDKFVRVESNAIADQIKFVVLRGIDNQVSDQFHKVVRVNQYHQSKLVWTSFYATCTINDSFQLQKFPFDRHVFSIVLQSPDVKLVPWQHKKELAEFRKFNGLLEGVESQGGKAYLVTGTLRKFLLKGLSVSFTPVVSHSKTVNDAEFLVNIHVERDTGYYFLNFVFIMYLICAAASALIGVLPDVIAARNGVSVTLLLSLITFKFTLMANSPKVGYTTYMDQYFRIALLYLIAGVIINVTLSTRFQCRIRGFLFLCSSSNFEDCDPNSCNADTLREYEGLNTDKIEFPIQVALFCGWSLFNLIVFYYFKHPEKIQYSWERVMENKEKAVEGSAFSTNQALSTVYMVPEKPENM